MVVEEAPSLSIIFGLEAKRTVFVAVISTKSADLLTTETKKYFLQLQNK